jgi:hypothetical protein
MDTIQTGAFGMFGDAGLESRVGAALLWYNKNTMTLRTKQAWAGLSGPAVNGIHIHGLANQDKYMAAPNPYAANSQNVIWAIAAGTMKDDATPNTFTSVTAAASAGAPSQETDLNNGIYYYNVHTGTNPNGEIRGQITQSRCYPYTGMPCPAPAAAPAGSSSTGMTGSSTGTAGSAGTLVASGFLFTLLAVIAALLQ